MSARQHTRAKFQWPNFRFAATGIITGAISFDSNVLQVWSDANMVRIILRTGAADDTEHAPAIRMLMVEACGKWLAALARWARQNAVFDYAVTS